MRWTTNAIQNKIIQKLNTWRGELSKTIFAYGATNSKRKCASLWHISNFQSMVWRSEILSVLDKCILPLADLKPIGKSCFIFQLLYFVNL